MVDMPHSQLRGVYAQVPSDVAKIDYDDAAVDTVALRDVRY